MTPIYDWAQRHAISLDALRDLQTVLGTYTPPLPVDDPGQGKSEAWAQSATLLEASNKDVRLWRNNSGAFKDDRGRLVRYGLANTSKELNETLKSPDLVGWRGVVIQPQHVGHKFGLCVLREMKEPGWQYRGDAHELAQWRFLAMAQADGCDAGFATGPGTL